ncbi:MAG: hypothetical protein R2762_04855 [Bryobacteraceae bacterium]
MRPLIAALPTGTHNASVIVGTTTPGVIGAPVTIPVTVTVDPATPPSLSVKAASISQWTILGGADPAPVSLSVNNAGGGGLPWSATVSHPWIVLSSASGTAPSLPSVRLVTASLPVGTHTGSVTFTSPGAQNSPVVIPVSLIVHAFGTSGRQFHASAAGSPSGDGSLGNPWDLATVLGLNSGAGPGDIVWVHGGTHRSPNGYFNVLLAGNAANPVIVRQYPGERATIEGGLYCYGAYAWFWGLEVVSAPGVNRGESFVGPMESLAPGQRFINMVVHDNNSGINLWSAAVDAEAYGNVIFNNGYHDGSSRGHGHGIYTQNSTGLKTIHDNIVFNTFGFGLHGYSTEAGAVRNYDVRRNIIFNAGVLNANRPHYDNMFFGSGSVMENIHVENNYTFHTPAASNGQSRLNWGGQSRDIVVRGNHWIGGHLAVGVQDWDDVDFRNNMTYTETGTQVLMTTLPTQDTGRYLLDSNTYYGADIFSFNGVSYPFNTWKILTGKDAVSARNPSRPVGVQTFVLPNKYERGRANIVVYNWDGAASAAVDFSTFLAPGATYEVRNAQNFFGAPVAQGVYAGGSVSLPMTGLTAVPAQGANVPSQPLPTGPEFNVFVVLMTGP